MMKFYGDYHTHSHYSDGRQTIREIAAAAQKRGIREVAVTDHGPHAAVIGVNNAETYMKIKNEVKSINESHEYEILIFTGAEANIKGLSGDLDVPREIIAELDLLIVGMHPYTLPTSIDDGMNIWVQNSLRHFGKSQQEKAQNANTKATVEALYRNPEIDILAHPGLFFKIDMEEVARACIKNEVLFEINCAHEHPELSDIIIVDKLGTEFIVNSDAHFPDSVAKLDYGEKLIERLGIESDRVANYRYGGNYDEDKSYSQPTFAHYYRPIRRRQDASRQLP
jgi:putative hydrolase